MATLATTSNPPSPSRQRRKSCARRCERFCWSLLTAFPLGFVYSLTTWAAWVQATIGFSSLEGSWTGHGSAFIGIALWALLNCSYTVAVFTDPGSPLSQNYGYSSLPTHESGAPSLTAKSTGEYRFCKKCQTRKPDRAHHCSSCKRCVMKMDHHCPWLATCVGFRNYKPFVLFLVYTCLFCYVDFLVSASWVWGMIATGREIGEENGFMPVQYVLLCAISGIIGLVLTGFTGWHVYLASQGQTTIESLEKTRYLTPIRQSMRHQQDRQYVGEEEPSSPGLVDQLREVHANALPGVTRPEEGEDVREVNPSARQSLRRNFRDLEHQREHDRYTAYLNERDSEKLPNAFDHGWKRNLWHVFGPNPVLWMLPICNTTGDGWNWEPSPKWLEAREELAKERQAREREERALNEQAWAHHAPAVDVRGGSDVHQVYDKRLANSVPASDISMRTLPTNNASRPNSSRVEDDEDGNRERLLPPETDVQHGQWNDLPGDMVPLRGSSRGAMRTRSPRSMRVYHNG